MTNNDIFLGKEALLLVQCIHVTSNHQRVDNRTPSKSWMVQQDPPRVFSSLHERPVQEGMLVMNAQSLE